MIIDTINQALEELDKAMNIEEEEFKIYIDAKKIILEVPYLTSMRLKALEIALGKQVSILPKQDMIQLIVYRSN